MVNAPPIVHPGLAAQIPGYWPATIAIERATVTLSPETGQEVRTWGVVPGMGALAARVAPVVSGPATVSEAERRAGMYTSATEGWIVSLPAYWPDIRVTDRVAAPGGRYWNIVGVEYDGSYPPQWTRLEAEVVS